MASNKKSKFNRLKISKELETNKCEKYFFFVHFLKSLITFDPWNGEGLNINTVILHCSSNFYVNGAQLQYIMVQISTLKQPA